MDSDNPNPPPKREEDEQDDESNIGSVTALALALNELIKILVDRGYLDDKDVERIRSTASWFP